MEGTALGTWMEDTAPGISVGGMGPGTGVDTLVVAGRFAYSVADVGETYFNEKSKPERKVRTQPL